MPPLQTTSLCCVCRRKEAFQRLRHSGSLTRKSIIEVQHPSNARIHPVMLLLLMVNCSAYCTLVRMASMHLAEA